MKAFLRDLWKVTIGIVIMAVGFIGPLALFRNSLGAMISGFIMFLLLENAQRNKLDLELLLRVGSYFKLLGWLMVSSSFLYFTKERFPWESLLLISFGIAIYYTSLLMQLDWEIRKEIKTGGKK